MPVASMANGLKAVSCRDLAANSKQARMAYRLLLSLPQYSTGGTTSASVSFVLRKNQQRLRIRDEVGSVCVCADLAGMLSDAIYNGGLTLSIHFVLMNPVRQRGGAT
jgi:hypothetical protein